MTPLLIYALEMLCYSGNILSGIIALNIWRIQEKTLFNKMFMVYFAIDCLVGVTDPYYLFKLYKERSVLEILIILSLALSLNFTWTLSKVHFSNQLRRLGLVGLVTFSVRYWGWKYESTVQTKINLYCMLIFQRALQAWHQSGTCQHNIFFALYRYEGDLLREQNCIAFLATWMLWSLQRQLVNTIMMGLR